MNLPSSKATASQESLENESSFIDPPAPKKIKSKKSEDLWLMSFGDLSMILISFFILMLSFSKVDKHKAEIVQETMKTEKQRKAEPRQDTLVQVSQKIQAEIKAQKLDKSAEVIIDAGGVSIEFKDGLLFSVGLAAPNPSFRPVVDKVMQVISKTPERFSLRFEGHTDDVPISQGQYPSNWELSAARGITLMRQFEKRGVASERMSVLAYAHTKPKKPIASLRGEELAKARAANRRVVIRIE